MFTLPNTFKEENENYITLTALRNFAKSRGLKTNISRSELIQVITDYANNNGHQEEVLHWVDRATKQGIKDIYLKKININKDAIKTLKDIDLLEAKLAEFFQEVEERNLCLNQYNEKLKMVKYEINETINGTVTSFFLCKMIYTEDNRGVAKSYLYPINIDIYIDKQIITGRAKPKSSMYEYSSVALDTTVNKSTTAEIEIREAIKFIIDIFLITTKKHTEVYDYFRGQLYKMLDKFTRTPLEIQEMIDKKQADIQQISEKIRADICCVDVGYNQDIDSDINNLVEKYLSISYPDKSIFTRNREAYPLTINATDEEESHVEQTAGFEEPLQSKAIFFDNKKMMQKSKLCDSVKFCYIRLNPQYVKKSFSVKVIVKKDYCFFKFTEYTLEEDINSVLFSIIDA